MAAPACTAAPPSWLQVPAVPPVATVAADPVSAAAVDLVRLYRYQMYGEPERDALAARLESGASEVRQALGAAGSEAGSRGGPTLSEGAVILLRLRILEALAAALQRDAFGVDCAARAESLSIVLGVRADEMQPESAALLPVVAGLRSGRGESRRVAVALAGVWQQNRVAPRDARGASRDFLLLHVVAQHESRFLDVLRAQPARDGWEATALDLADALGAGRLQLFRADDPARRLLLAVHALVGGGVLPRGAADAAARAAADAADGPEAHAASRARLDSLGAALAVSAARTAPILGSRHDYYLKAGQVAPSLEPRLEASARQLGVAALADLRALLGDRALAASGLDALAEVEPVEIVPGQAVGAVWTLAASAPASLTVERACIGPDTLAARPPRLEIAAGGTAVVRSGFVPQPLAAPGTTLLSELRLCCTLPEWGPVEVVDRVAVRVVAPVQASLTPVDGPLVEGDTKSVEVLVTSRAPQPIQGVLRVLATSDWKVRPARSFRFDLRRPGQSARQQLELDLPALASPGAYELAVRLEVEGQSAGTLRAALVKPLRWVAVGPFAPPRARAHLPPENGVSMSARYDGLAGQIVWQVVPREAYDPDGSLDLEAMYPDLQRPACACAFTVLESPEAAPAALRTTGTARILWNGLPPAPGGEVRVERGRNTLLLRACSGPQGWALDATLRDSRGEPLRVLANDLARLLDGYSDLGRAEPRAASGQPSDRVVVLHFRGTGAAQEVAVLGTFNAWVPTHLQRQPDGSWQRELRLAPGRYAYKLLVDGRLRPDPEAQAYEPDGFGGRNSLLIVR